MAIVSIKYLPEKVYKNVNGLFPNYNSLGSGPGFEPLYLYVVTSGKNKRIALL